MADKTTHAENATNENADNMAQNEVKEEVLSNGPEAEDGENTEAGAPVEGDDEKVKKLQGELDEMRDKNLRLVAEFDNFRRRSAKEQIEMRATAGKDIIQSLLVVLDDLDRASRQMETSTDPAVIKEGISLVFNKLKQILQQKGLKVMDAENKEFDSDLHEAITELPAPDEKMKGKIMNVVESGYYLNDKLIRHAKVVVGK